MNTLTHPKTTPKTATLRITHASEITIKQATEALDFVWQYACRKDIKAAHVVVVLDDIDKRLCQLATVSKYDAKDYLDLKLRRKIGRLSRTQNVPEEQTSKVVRLSYDMAKAIGDNYLEHRKRAIWALATRGILIERIIDVPGLHAKLEAVRKLNQKSPANHAAVIEFWTEVFAR